MLSYSINIQILSIVLYYYIITLINIKDSYKLLNPIIIIMYNEVKYYMMFNIK